ncbi:MAG: HK97 family phage prohead protease [Alphaproteobacteria bacterium]|nr:HK97 family phage prohead protease [Alphaproteobacteria bacterium]
MTEPRFQPKHIMNLPLELKATGDAGAEAGTFEGYGAIFGNLDRDGDVVSPGAFAESLKGRMPALLWQHNAKEPIGRFDVVREDAKGLFVRGRLSMEGRGREAYELLKMGALDGLSIGFVTKEASRNALSGTRTITKADLMEISLVTFPANDLARVSNVKAYGNGNVPETKDAFIRMLIGYGFSNARAQAIADKGARDVFSTKQGVDEAVSYLVDARQRLMNGIFDHCMAEREVKGYHRAVERLLPGRFASGLLNRPTINPDNWLFPGLPKGRTRFKVKPPHRYAYFDCVITYWAWNGRRYEQREIELWQNEYKALTEIEKDTPSEDGFNPFDLDDWRTAAGRLVADKRISYKLTYHKGEKPRGMQRPMDGDPRREEKFEISVS